MKAPVDCVCPVAEWLDPNDVPPICATFKGEDEFIACDTCEHDNECHHPQNACGHAGHAYRCDCGERVCGDCRLETPAGWLCVVCAKPSRKQGGEGP